MSARSVRRVVLVVCVIGIAGMIVSSIADNNGAALTAGLTTAVAVLCLIVTTAVTTGPVSSMPGAPEALDLDEDAEATAEELEGEIQGLVAGGVDEVALRRVVGLAVRLGKERVR